MNALDGEALLDISLRLRELVSLALSRDDIVEDDDARAACIASWDVTQCRFQAIATALTDVDYLGEHEDLFVALGLVGAEIDAVRHAVGSMFGKRQSAGAIVHRIEAARLISYPASQLPGIGPSYAALDILAGVICHEFSGAVKASRTVGHG